MADDDDLAKRLAALATPKTPSSSKADAKAEDLESRFARVFGARGFPATRLPGQGSAPKNAEDDKSIQELAAEVHELKSSWEVSAADESAIDAVLNEVAGIVKEEQARDGGAEENVVPDWLRPNTLDEVRSDVDEGETVLKRIRDELAFEIVHGGVDGEQGARRDDNHPIEEFQEDTEIKGLMDRFQALGVLEGGPVLPAVPIGVPGSAKVTAKKSKGSISSEEAVDETDTWCCICNEDAEYRCSGCDNDIYCGECLFEAHTGPGAGLEERRHKWTKYVRPKKILRAA